jgi:hypothetical protein
MVLLLMIFGKIWGKPWYGEHARLVQGFATGPGKVELAGGAFLPVPGSITPEIHPVTLVSLFEKPERPRGGHHEAKRVGPDHALDLPALVLAQAVEGIAVANGDFNGIITNDKFCCTRWGKLLLSWWRRPQRLRS